MKQLSLYKLLSFIFLLTLSLTEASAQFMTGTGAVDAYTYNGSRSREYDVYVPQSYNGTTAVPMIFALHGCAMDHDDARNLWNLDLIADANNVIVVFPFVTSFSEFRNENCWGYWFDTHVQEGANGEVDDLYGIGLQVESNYNIDPDRRYITGISSGGGMAVAAAIAYNEYWAAVAPVEALAYGDGSSSVTADQFNSLSFHVDKINAELDDNHAVPTFVVHSTNDTVVMITGGELIRDSHLTVWGPDLNADGTEDCTAEGISCTITTYNGSDGNPLVQTMFYDGITSQSASYGSGHYWSGDDDATSLWAEGEGPSNSQHIWAFFENITFQGYSSCEDPNDTTPPATPSGLSADDIHDKYAILSASQNTEADFKKYNIYRSNGASLGSSTANPLTVSGLTPETSYSVYITAEDKCGNESGASNTVSFTTTPLEYVAPSVSATCTEHYNAGRLNTNEYIDCGGEHGYIDDVTLWQLQDGSWVDQDPNGGGTNPTPTPTPTSNPATPTPTPTSQPGNCSDYTSSNSTHASAGRAYAQWGWYYYATGSNAYLGFGSSSTTLRSTDGSYWEQGSCP